MCLSFYLYYWIYWFSETDNLSWQNKFYKLKQVLLWLYIQIFHYLENGEVITLNYKGIPSSTRCNSYHVAMTRVKFIKLFLTQSLLLTAGIASLEKVTRDSLWRVSLCWENCQGNVGVGILVFSVFT